MRKWIGAAALLVLLAPRAGAQPVSSAQPSAQPAPAAQRLPGTQPLTIEGDLASLMIDGIDRFLLKETEAAAEARGRRRPGEALIIPDAARLARMIGAADARTAFDAPRLVATVTQPALVGRGHKFEAFAVSWPVVGGIEGEGLLLVPTENQGRVADVIALPDADQTPEMIAGLVPGVPAESQFARRLAESGCRVLVPMLIDRADTYSVSAAGQATNQPHREWVYRPAFEMGRHVIGYEVQKVLAGVDWFARGSGRGTFGPTGIGVIGYGEGGLLALYAAAIDPRINVACVSGYFGSRQSLWQEPIYRNVFGLLNEFGDAELAGVISSPRALIVEACRGPEVGGPPAPREGRRGAAPGRLVTPPLDSVRREFERIKAPAGGTGPGSSRELVVSGDGAGPFGSDAALRPFLHELAEPQFVTKLSPPGKAPEHFRKDFDPQPRLRRQIAQMTERTQALVRESEHTRKKFWEKADRAARSPEKWAQTTRWYRDYFYNDVIGRFDRPLLPPNVRTRRVHDEPKYTGYEVVMDVFPDVIASGILLVPKDIKDGERRPVVVCQHGLEGRPRDVADPKVNNPSYNQFACRLAERGFVTFSPQNPYIFGDRFRALQRKANPLGKTLFSIIVPQHQQATDWLASLPFVDPDRVAFYGLSYGGKTAMRVPPLVDRYCLSICSADFNEWVWKNTSVRSTYSYVTTIEYEIFEWDLGNTFNYAEMAGLICPRPFMVERGHRDGVAPDEMVAHEFAKVKLLYTDLRIGDRARIEFFDGPHTIHGVGTFEFLHEWLKWSPPPK